MLIQKLNFKILIFILLSLFNIKAGKDTVECPDLVKELERQIAILRPLPFDRKKIPADVAHYVVPAVNTTIEALNLVVSLFDGKCSRSRFNCITLKNLTLSVAQLISSLQQSLLFPPNPNIVIAQNEFVHVISYTYGCAIALFSEVLINMQKNKIKCCPILIKKECTDILAKSLEAFIKPLRQLGATVPKIPGIIAPTETTNTTIINIMALNTLHGCDLTAIVCNTLKQLNIQIKALIEATKLTFHSQLFPAAFTLVHTQEHLQQIFDPLYVLVLAQEKIRK